MSFWAFWMSGLHALRLERLLELGTVAVLPTARRRSVGQDDAGALARCRSACPAARLAACGAVVPRLHPANDTAASPAISAAMAAFLVKSFIVLFLEYK